MSAGQDAARYVADLGAPFAAGQVVKFACRCGYQTDWYRLNLEALAARELDAHPCADNASH